MGWNAGRVAASFPQIAFFLFFFFRNVFLSLHLLLTLRDDCYPVPASCVASTRRCVKGRALATAESCVCGGRRAAHCDPVVAAGRHRKGGVGGKKRPAVAGHGEGDMRSQQKG